MIKQVDIRAVEKDLIKTPKALVIKFQKWVDDIEKYGLEEVRKVRVGMTIRSRVTARGKGPFT
jgi:hypothetical protein